MVERVVVTGVGMASPTFLSTNSEDLLNERVLSRREEKNNGINALSEELEKYIPYKILRRICRFSQLALYSNVLCKIDSKITIDGENDNIGSVMNTSYGPLNVTENLLNDIIYDGPLAVSPAEFSNTVNNCATGQVSITMGLKGVSTTLVGSSGINYAYDLIRNGKASAIFVSGVEELNENVKDVTKAKGFSAMENSCCILMESYSHAMERNAHIYSEILSCDSFYLNDENADKLYTKKLNQYAESKIIYGNSSLNCSAINEHFMEKNYLDSCISFGTVFGATELVNNTLAAAMINKSEYYTNNNGIEKQKINIDENVISISIQQGNCCSVIVQAGVK